MLAPSLIVALAAALALPARAADAPPTAPAKTGDSSGPSEQDMARFNALKQRFVTSQGISRTAVGGTLPAPPPPPKDAPPPPSWQQQEEDRRGAFDGQFGTGSYDGIVGFSRRCFVSEGCDKPAIADLFGGANRYVGLRQEVDAKTTDPQSPDYKRREARIKERMKPALRDLAPRPGGDTGIQSEFIKVSDPIVKKVFTPQELLQYVKSAAAAADSAPYYAYLGRTLSAAGDAPGARQAFGAALAKDPNSAEALSGRAEVEYKQGDFGGAVTDARAALALAPGDRSALATLRFSEGRLPAGGSGGDAGATVAAAFAGGAAAGGPGAAGGGAGGAAGVLPASLTAGAPASAELARRSEEQVGQARRALGMGDARSALESLRRAVELNPGNAQARSMAAMARIRLKDYAGALDEAEAGLKLAPNGAALWDAKAFALNGLKDYRAALAAADRALAINSNDAVARFQRAAALGGLGDRDGMLEELKEAAALDPRFQRALDEASRLPKESDILYLFPGEETAAAPAAPAKGADGGPRPAWVLLAEGAAAGVGLALAAGLLLRRSRPAPPPLASVVKTGRRRLGGKYELGKEIGTGGALYEGYDRSLERRVAIRRVRRALRADPRERARFLAEARTLAALRHPNIAGVLDIVEEAGEAFVIVERPEGRTLRDLLAQEKAIPFRRARDLFRGVAAALDEAHRQGILHKDVCPEHVVVDDAGRARLTEFGGDGSPAYAAPEQDQSAARRESDVYAMAACLYEALTGRKPFDGIGPGLLLNKLQRAHAPASRRAAGVPGGIDELFARAFAPKPEDRYPTAGEFLRALESLDAA